jgi:hypothetical protein
VPVGSEWSSSDHDRLLRVLAAAAWLRLTAGGPGNALSPPDSESARVTAKDSLAALAQVGRHGRRAGANLARLAGFLVQVTVTSGCPSGCCGPLATILVTIAAHWAQWPGPICWALIEATVNVYGSYSVTSLQCCLLLLQVTNIM